MPEPARVVAPPAQHNLAAPEHSMCDQCHGMFVTLPGAALESRAGTGRENITH